MGMGGYFIIKSVEYDLGETSEQFQINISAKFLGTDADRPAGRESEEEETIGETDTCAKAFNLLAEKVNPFLENFDDRVETISTSTQPPPKADGEREPEVPKGTETVKTKVKLEDFLNSLEGLSAYTKLGKDKLDQLEGLPREERFSTKFDTATIIANQINQQSPYLENGNIILNKEGIPDYYIVTSANGIVLVTPARVK